MFIFLETNVILKEEIMAAITFLIWHLLKIKRQNWEKIYITYMKVFHKNLAASIYKFLKILCSYGRVCQGTVACFQGSFQITYAYKPLPVHRVCIRDLIYGFFSWDAETDFLLPWLLGAQFKVKLLPIKITGRRGIQWPGYRLPQDAERSGTQALFIAFRVSQ